MKVTAQTQRYELSPLAHAAGGEGITYLARTFGVDRRTIHRWRSKGLNATMADRTAVRLGVLPFEIWPDWLRP